MSATDHERALIAYWWEKAEASLQSARREHAAGANAYAVNRLYYAAFYAVSAALFERKETATKHSGIRSAFHRIFVKPGLVENK